MAKAWACMCNSRLYSLRDCVIEEDDSFLGKYWQILDMELITQQSELDELIEKLRNKAPQAVAVDLEADNLHRYEERMCLVQMFDGEEFHLIDPLVIDDFSGFLAFLETTELWMHGTDYDMSLFLSEWGVIPKSLKDTQIAARLVGHTKFGYAALVDHFHGVVLSKSSQREDWRQRPLPAKMLEYALNDVRYLLEIAASLEKDLKEKGRYAWFEESLKQAHDKAHARHGKKEDPWRINGSGKLKPKGLHFLKEIWHWRDEEARDWDKPPFMVVGNKALIEWCEDLTHDETPRLPKQMRPDRKRRFMKVMERAQQIPQSEWPEKLRFPRHQWTEAEEAVLDQLINRRNTRAAELEIDPSLIAPRAILEALATNRELNEPLMSWQEELLA